MELAFAELLLAARADRRVLAESSENRPPLTPDQGYAIGKIIQRSCLDQGWQQVGWKLGMTNPAAWERLGVSGPFYAPVYQETVKARRLQAADLVQPKIEAELVIGLRRAVGQDASRDEIRDGIGWLAAGIEFVECHYPGWVFTPAEAIADGGLHGALVVGPARQVSATDTLRLKEFQCRLERNGAIQAEGSAAAVMGDPFAALCWIVAAVPGGLAAEDMVTTGTMVTPIDVAPGEHWRHAASGPVELAPVEIECA
jgi:2-oxo-3-hexenedioate decarboxylase